MKPKHRTTIFRLAWLFRRLRAKRTFTTRALAMEFEVSERTMGRDIELLRNCGAIETEIVANPEGRGTVQALVGDVRCPFCHHNKR